MAVSPPQDDLQVTADGDGLRGKSIFITGGTGFLGSWLVETLLHENRVKGLGLRITALSRNPQQFLATYPHLARDGALALHQGDVASFNFPPGQFGLAVHAALPVATAVAGDIGETARRGAQRVADFARRRGIPRLLHVSSGAVYGPQSAGVERIKEERPWDTAAAPNDYTRAKRLEEEVFGEAVEGCVTARVFALIAPRLSPATGTAAALFIAQAAQGLGIRVEGDGLAIRSYQYAADTASWLIALLARGLPGRAYNVGSEEEVSIAGLAEKIRSCAKSGPVEILGRPAPGRAGFRYVPDTSRARHELGLTNRIGLDEAIDRSLRWRRSSPLPSSHE